MSRFARRSASENPWRSSISSTGEPRRPGHRTLHPDRTHARATDTLERTRAASRRADHGKNLRQCTGARMDRAASCRSVAGKRSRAGVLHGTRRLARLSACAAILREHQLYARRAQRPRRGANVIAQEIAPDRGDRASLGSNPDVTADLIPGLRERERDGKRRRSSGRSTIACRSCSAPRRCLRRASTSSWTTRASTTS